MTRGTEVSMANPPVSADDRRSFAGESDDPFGVDVWLTRLDAVGERDRGRFASLLEPAERARFERFQVAGAREEYLVGRALVRSTLSRYAATAPKDWRFVANAYGRPEIVGGNRQGLVFNLSHTRGLVALAVSRDCDLGVDVESVERTSACRDLAGRYFAPSEAGFVRAATGTELDERFFAFWTLKEAYIKARGMGLALPLDGFAFDLGGSGRGAEVGGGPGVDLDPDPTIAFMPSCPDDPGRWRFMRRSVSAEHRLALAVSPAATGPIRFFATVPLSGRVETLDPSQRRPADVGGGRAPTGPGS